MTPEERINAIRTRIENAFSPTSLEIKDDSEKHKGHAGAKDGAGHFTLIIESECFKNKNLIQSHREIYKVLDDLIPQEIHAIAIKIKN